MEDHERGRDSFSSDEDYKLHCLRHSAAHMMAQAIVRLHPTAKLAIGPVIQDGFYYDIDLATPLREEDLEAISAEMKRIVKENQVFEHEEWDKARAREFFGSRGEVYKLELIDGIEGDSVSIYRNKNKKSEDAFIDLCAGPHALRTGQLKHFKLLKVSGAYWRADQSKAQLQRVYGTCWSKKDDLEAHLFRLEEAKKRDHRKLGKELELFMFHEFAPGSAFWLPRGEFIYHTLSQRMRSLLSDQGYQVVRTPLLFDKKLWEISGHWSHYKDAMFSFGEDAAPGDESEHHRVCGLKPMNCPSHMLIFASTARSYRELPMRIHDQGVLHRDELSGALSGLTRVRQFCQDDAHLFCTQEQIESEVKRLLELIDKVYSAFDMSHRLKLSTRPDDRMGDDGLWDNAEASLKAALDAHGVDYEINEGDGAFYGPKIDFDVLDALGRAHQCATVQLDFQLPIRFDLSYTSKDGSLRRPVVIHRAIYGSFERFIGILIEHWAGKFPMWLAPEQVRVMTVSEKSQAHGEHVTRTLKDSGIRVQFNDTANKIGYKIRECHQMKVPYMAIVGEAESKDGSVSIRSRDHGDLGSLALAEFVERVVQEGAPKL